MDAAAYMAQLRSEAEVLRKELNVVQRQEVRRDIYMYTCIYTYIGLTRG